MVHKKEGSRQQFEALIDDNLKKIYSDLVQEELPDRFKDLLAQLKMQDDGGDKK